MDFRKKQDVHSPLNISGERVERVSSFRFLGTHISEDLTWTANTTALVKKAQQQLLSKAAFGAFGVLLLLFH